MSSVIKYNLYKDSSEVEATRLRSILLFNGKVSKQKRKDIMSKAVLSLILAGNGSATRDSILQQLFEQFNVKYPLSELNEHIKRLYTAKLIESIDEPFVVIDKVKGKDFFQQLDRETESFVESIIIKAQLIYGTIHQNELVKGTIQKALSVYYGMYGYSFFGPQKKEEASVKNAAVSIVLNDIKDNRLSESVIRALADVIENPNAAQAEILKKWARAFVALETMSIDPLLNNLKSKNLKEKEFVIDTDVALHCLTQKSRFSEDYRQMIERMKCIGCKMFLVPDVVAEIRKHIDAAKKQYNFYRTRLLEFPDDMLEQKIGNVFIDDYVHLNRDALEKTPFKYYIEEFYDPEYPDSQKLLIRKIQSVFGENVIDDPYKVDTTGVKFLTLESEVYNLTMQTPKAQKRTEEENHDVSHLDTYLYLAASKNNETTDSLEMLAGKTYILTDSTRALRAASNLGWQKEEVICHPNALMAILMEIGDVKSQEMIVNLFENPFLVHVADNIWDEVGPLLDKGATIKYKSFEKLKVDVDKSLDKVLTADMPEEERRNALNEFGVYLPEMVEEGKQREVSQQEKIKKLLEENEALKKSLIAAKSSRARSPKKLNVKSGRNKKRKK